MPVTRGAGVPCAGRGSRGGTQEQAREEHMQEVKNTRETRTGRKQGLSLSKVRLSQRH